MLIYRDGSVQVNHGGAEMGQGLHTKIQQIAAESLGVDLERVRVMSTRTDKIPNTSATAASAGTDLNGAAVADACSELRGRLAQVAGTSLRLRCGRGRIFPMAWSFRAAKNSAPFRSRKFATRRIASACRCSRKATTARPGFIMIRKPAAARRSTISPMRAAVSEVEVDGFTGDYRLLRTDILEDVGDSVSPLVDRGQIEGGFIQGVGWLTLEELVWDAQGRLATAGASTYKLPSWTEVPEVFEVNFLERAAEPGAIFGSKAVGEPPLMLAMSVREAIRDAIAAFGAGGPVMLASPATPERVFFAVRAGARGAGIAGGELRLRMLHASEARRQGANCCARPCFTRRAIRFANASALENYADGGLLIRDGRVAGVRRLRDSSRRASERPHRRSARRFSSARLHRHAHAFPATARARRIGPVIARLAGALRAARRGAHGGSFPRLPRGSRVRARAGFAWNHHRAGVRRALRSGNGGAV